MTVWTRWAWLTYQNQTRPTHIGQSAGRNTDDGFDDLRRVVNHRWETTTGAGGELLALGAEARVVEFSHRRTDLTPAYDRANNKLIEEKRHDTGNSEAYTYQSDYQLLTFDRGSLDGTKTFIQTPTATPGALQRQTWRPDSLGNWTENTHATAGTGTFTEFRTATDYNEIATVSGVPYGGGSTTGLSAQQYDKNDNLLDDFVWTYEYDALNRLRKVYRKPLEGPPALIAEYSYDADNRRFRKVVRAGGLDGTATNGTTDFFYDGWRVIEEREPTAGVTQQYVYGIYLDELWTLDNRRGGRTVGQLNARSRSDRYFYHSNTLYSVYGLTDDGAFLLEAYQYDAYGPADGDQRRRRPGQRRQLHGQRRARGGRLEPDGGASRDHGGGGQPVPVHRPAPGRGDQALLANRQDIATV